MGLFQMSTLRVSTCAYMFLKKWKKTNKLLESLVGTKTDVDMWTFLSTSTSKPHTTTA